MFERFTDRTRRVLVLARQHAHRMQHAALEAHHLLLGMLEEAKATDGSAERLLGIDIESAKAMVDRIAPLGNRPPDAHDALPFGPSARALLVRATAEADASRSEGVDLEHLVLALALDESHPAAKLVEQNGRSLEQVRRDVRDILAPRAHELESVVEETHRTPALDAFCHNLVDRAHQGQLDPFVGRGAELERLYEILLCRRDANALLVGSSGSGKTALARGLAIAIAEGTAPTPLLSAKLFAVNSLALLAGTRYRGQLEERVKALLYEARKLSQVILFIDDAQALLGEEGASTAWLTHDVPGAGFLSMLKHAFDAAETRFILALDSAALARFRIAQPSAQRHLQEIDVAPASKSETGDILRALKPQFELYHDVRIDDAALATAVLQRPRLQSPGDPKDRALPGRAVDLIDRACSEIALASTEPTEDLKQIESEIARLQHEEAENVKAREYIAAAAGREALDTLEKRRERILSERRGQRAVDAAAIERAAASLAGV